MKVMHVSNYLPHMHLRWGGAEVACQNIVNMLIESGDISCGVISTIPQHKVSGPFELFSVETIHDKYYAPNFHDLRHFWLQKDPGVKKQVKKILELFKPDLMHFHNFHILTFSALEAAVEMSIPTAVSIYDYWFFCPTDMLLDHENKICERGQGFGCMKHCLKKRFTKKSQYLSNLPIVTRKINFLKHLSLFDRIITLSENSRQVVWRHGSSSLKADVIPLPIEGASENRVYSLSRNKTIMFAGWVQARKGPDIVVRAMADVVKEMPDAKLMIVGPLSESSFEAYINDLANRLGVSDNVVFTGKLSTDEFQKTFQKSHVVVIAEQWENMSPLFVLESMSAKKAIVVGEIGGIPEYIRNGKEGLTCVYDDPGDYAKAILTLLKDRKYARQLGENAAKRVEQMCSRDIVLKKLLITYKRIIDGEPSPIEEYNSNYVH